MKVSIHQPSFLPWSGLFHKILSSDVHVFYSTASFTKRGYQNRVMYDGSWLTLPVKMKGIQHEGDRVDAINNIQLVDYSRNVGKIVKRMAMTEKSKPYFKRIEPILDCLAVYNGDNLADLNIQLTMMICSILDPGMGVRFVMDEHLHIEGEDPVDKLNSMIEQVGGTTYMSGRGMLNYLNDKMRFPIEIQDFEPDVSTETIIKIITEHESPLEYLHEKFKWSNL